MAYGHAGRVDASGGHHDRKNGGYHYHGGKPPDTARTEAKEETGDPEFSLRTSSPSGPRLEARTRVRTEPPKLTSSRSLFNQEEKAAPPKAVDKGEQTPSVVSPEPKKQRWEFHLTYAHPYKVFEFRENGAYWSVDLTSGKTVNLRKPDVIRIEPVRDYHDLRSWLDRTGEHSTVAKFMDRNADQVTLETIAGKEVNLAIRQLSPRDGEFLALIQSNKWKPKQ